MDIKWYQAQDSNQEREEHSHTAQSRRWLTMPAVFARHRNLTVPEADPADDRNQKRAGKEGREKSDQRRGNRHMTCLNPLRNAGYGILLIWSIKDWIDAVWLLGARLSALLANNNAFALSSFCAYKRARA